MNREFDYRAKFSYWIATPALVFAGLAAYCQVNESGIAFKRLELLAFPNSVYAALVLAVLFAGYFVFSLKSSRDLNANGAPIRMHADAFDFPEGAAKVVSVRYADVNELWTKEDDDGASVIVMSENGKHRHEFLAENFGAPALFSEFRAILLSSCVNITNAPS